MYHIMWINWKEWSYDSMVYKLQGKLLNQWISTNEDLFYFGMWKLSICLKHNPNLIENNKQITQLMWNICEMKINTLLCTKT